MATDTPPELLVRITTVEQLCSTFFGPRQAEPLALMRELATQQVGEAVRADALNWGVIALYLRWRRYPDFPTIADMADEAMSMAMAMIRLAGGE